MMTTTTQHHHGNTSALQPLKVLLTGGPCGGKSSAIRELAALLRRRGHRVFIVPEAASLLITNGCSYPGLHADPVQIFAFEEAVISVQIAMEDAVRLVVCSSTSAAEKKQGCCDIILYDRGILDNRAYTTTEVWNKVLQKHRTTEKSMLARYDIVLHLVTAADGALRYYTLANNEARRESPEMAIQMDQAVRDCWKGHPRQVIIDNSAPNAWKGKFAVIQRVVLAALGRHQRRHQHENTRPSKL